MVREVSIEEMLEKVKEENNVLIDVRELEELQETGYIPTARHYPMSNFDSALSSLEKDKTYYVMCRAGGRSLRVQDYLLKHGFDAVNVKEGMDGYEGPVTHLK